MPKGRHRKTTPHPTTAWTSARVAGVVGASAVLAATATTSASAAGDASAAAPSAMPKSAAAPKSAAVPQAAAQPTAAKAAPERTYTVRAGDTLSRIAQRYGMSWQKLCAQNGIRDCDRIYPGQTLTIGAGDGDAAQRSARSASQERPSRAKRGGGGGVDLPAAASCIRKYESGHDYRAENPVSSASGAYQFIDSTWTAVTGLEPPASKYSKAVQDRAFVELWDGGRGAHHWVTAPKCGY